MSARPPHLYQSGRGRPAYALLGRFQPSANLSLSSPITPTIISKILLEVKSV